MISVRDTGARADFCTNDAAAIQQAIDRVHDAGGGTVLVPAGRYLCSTVRLRSHVTLHLEAGATLYASTRPEDYGSTDAERQSQAVDFSSRGVLLIAEHAQHIAVTGQGALDGQGTADLSRGQQRQPGMFRTRLVLISRCQQVTFRDLSLLNSDSWTLHLETCDDVLIDGIRILANKRRINSDGIDPDGCTNVRISNCHIVTGDDCIVIKSTAAADHASENIVVTNCTLESGATAIKLGTESHGDFRDIHVSNCVIRRSSGGIGLFLKDGATMERIAFSNISIDDWDDEPELRAAGPLFADIERRHPDSRLGRIRDVAFHHITTRGRFPSLLQGTPEHPIENLSLTNLNLRVDQPIDFASRRKRVGGRRSLNNQRDTEFARQPAALVLAHVAGLTLRDVVLTCENAAADKEIATVSLHDVTDAELTGIRRRAGQGPTVRKADPEHAVVDVAAP